MSATYYWHSGVICVVETDAASGNQSAMGYVAGEGFKPVAVLPVIWHGEEISEKEFKQSVTAQSIAARKNKL